MPDYSIIPFHDIEALFGKFRDCRYVFKVIGEVNIIAYWDPVEQKALVGHNNNYAYVTILDSTILDSTILDSTILDSTILDSTILDSTIINGNISIYNILDALGYVNLDTKVIKQWNIDMEPVPPNDTILAMSLSETPRCLILVMPKMIIPKMVIPLCGDGIDSDDYDSD